MEFRDQAKLPTAAKSLVKYDSQTQQRILKLLNSSEANYTDPEHP
ncbi:hypothetical protein ACU8KH_00692 [Lachancea thermotolerans]